MRTWMQWMGMVLMAAALLGAPAAADDFTNYEIDNAATFLLPQGSPGAANRGPAVFDNIADGRLLVITTDLPDPFGFTGIPQIYIETAVGSRTWDLLGELPLASGASWPSFGAGFLSISPDGTRVAVGDNNSGAQHVGVFDVADLLTNGPAAMSIDWFGASHALGAWFDNRHLALSYGDFVTSKISLLDTQSAVNAPVNPNIIAGIGGASGAVAFDAEGNLYTGNGFDSAPGGSATGDVRKFLKDGAGGWQQALDNAVPLNFESQGSFVTNSLSASSLVFDNEGNLAIGGSDFFGGGEFDFLALLQNPANGSGERTFDPDSVNASFYNLVFNEVTGELYANQPFQLIEPIDNTAVHVIAPVPEPSSLALLAVGGVALSLWRRKRGR